MHHKEMAPKSKVLEQTLKYLAWVSYVWLGGYCEVFIVGRGLTYSTVLAKSYCFSMCDFSEVSKVQFEDCWTSPKLP